MIQIEGDENVYVKTEGVMEDIPLVCLCAALREIDLYKTWIPACSRSDIIRWKSKYVQTTSSFVSNYFLQKWLHSFRSRALIHLAFSPPLLYRDAILEAFACDSMFEDGSFMVCETIYVHVCTNKESSHVSTACRPDTSWLR